MKPYYEDDAVTIYHGDCRETFHSLEADVLITDPPYGIAFKSGWTGAAIVGDADTKTRDIILAAWSRRPALMFGVAGEAKHPDAKTCLVWHRPGSGMGDLAMPWQPDYELIHVFGEGWIGERRGRSVLTYPWDVFRGAALHPHQKPIGLMRNLLAACPRDWLVIDPFVGSGTTLRAAKDLGRKAIGIEIDERYCEIAARRMGQEVMDFGEAA